MNSKQLAEKHRTSEKVKGSHKPINNYHFTEKDFWEFVQQLQKEQRTVCANTIAYSSKPFRHPEGTSELQQAIKDAPEVLQKPQ